MRTVKQYRELAAQCRNLAAQMDKAEQREQLMQMAQAWETIAEQRETALSQEEG